MAKSTKNMVYEIILRYLAVAGPTYKCIENWSFLLIVIYDFIMVIESQDG